MQAFDELYERYKKDDAYRLACLITGSRTDGEDLAQGPFVTCAVHQIAAGRQQIPAPYAAQNAFPRGMEDTAAKPNGKRRSQSFFDAGESEKRTVRRTADG